MNEPVENRPTSAGNIPPARAPLRTERSQDNSRRDLALWMGALTLCFGKPLLDLALFSARSELYSHVLLVPAIAFYFGCRHFQTLTREGRGWSADSLVFLLAGLAGTGTSLALWLKGVALGRNSYLSLTIFSYVSLVIALAGWFLGPKRLAGRRFSLFFLLFMVPMPPALEHGLEVFFQYSSAEVSDLLFKVVGTSLFRQGLVFHLPGITVAVAEECSGIRSSLVLLITCFVAGQLFLGSGWRRAVLALLVVPLGIIRNAIRIVTISLLCVHVDPSMSQSLIHTHGGPLFFVASLAPLLAALWVLRRTEKKAGAEP